MRVLSGKTLMDRNAPEALCDTPETAYEDSVDLIKKYHNKARISYVISPRFAITSTPEQLDVTRQLTFEHPTCYLQTHVSENHAEIELPVPYTQTLRIIWIFMHNMICCMINRLWGMLFI